MLGGPSLATAAVEIARWVSGRRQRFRVSGPSMVPTLTDGEFVLVDPSAVADVGELTLAVHPDDEGTIVVKRLIERRPGGSIVLGSDNPEGTDSRRWGPVAPSSLRGRVTLVLDRPLASLDATTADRGRAGWGRGDLTRWLRR